MYCIKIPKAITNIMSLFYRLGIWNGQEEPTVRETRIKFFYTVYYLSFPISLLVGAFTNNDTDESIFSAELGIAAVVLSLKFSHIIWKKNQIIEMLTSVGVYSVEDREEFNLVDDKLKKFTKFISVLVFMSLTAGSFAAVVPLFGSDKVLFLKIAFPLDWNNSEIAFWIATTYIFTQIFFSAITVLVSTIIWYLMVSCALRYKILGSQITKMGVVRKCEATANKDSISVKDKQILFLRDFVAAIDSHQHTREY